MGWGGIREIRNWYMWDRHWRRWTGKRRRATGTVTASPVGGMGSMSSNVGLFSRAGVGSRVGPPMLRTRYLRGAFRIRKFFDDVSLSCYKRIWTLGGLIWRLGRRAWAIAGFVFEGYSTRG